MTRYRIIAAAMLAGFGLPSAANAVVTTIASFSAPSNTDNFRFVNSGGAANRAYDATFYTTSTAGATTEGSVLTKFSFLGTPLADYITNVNALFRLDGVVAKGSLAGNYFGEMVEEGVSGRSGVASSASGRTAGGYPREGIGF